MNFALAEGAKTGRFLGRFCLYFFLLLHVLKLVDNLHNEENADGDADEIDDCLKELTVRNLGSADDPFHLAVVGLLSNQRKKRHDDAVDQRIDDTGEGGADDHTNGKINDVSLECKGFEFVPEFFHLNPSLPFNGIIISQFYFAMVLLLYFNRKGLTGI